MKQPLRYFSIGLLTASVILFVFYQFLGSKELTEEESIDEMIANIETEGFRVIPESEYIALSVFKHEDDKEQSDNDEDKDESKNKEKEITEQKKEKKESDKKDDKASEKEEDKKEKKEKKKAESYTLTIKENMMPSTISELLAENKIIKDATKFSQFLEDEGYSPRVQIGKHKLNSDMSHREIAEELIKFK